MTKVPFSQCGVWSGQVEYFKETGIDAWRRRVPYQVTNSLGIASSYAHIVWSFVRESARRGHDRDQPFHIIELGTGTGRFGFFFLKQMAELVQSRPDPNVGLRYVMTDVAESNIDFLARHPALKDFVADGALDFACFNPLHDDALHLRNQNVVFSADETEERFANPVILVGNYFFDCLAVDLFRLEQGRLEMALADPDARMAQNQKMNKTASMEEHGVKLTYAPVGEPVYDDPGIEATLRTTVASLDDGYLTFPIGGLHCLDRMHALAQRRMLFIASDKGQLPQYESVRSSEPAATMHGGNFTFSVPFGSLARHVEHLGGCWLGQTSQQSLSTILLNTTAPWEEMPLTRSTTRHFLDAHGHYHLYTQFVILRKNHEQLKLTAVQLLSFFNLVQWDPNMVVRLWPAIRHAAQHATPIQRREFAEGIERSAGYYYYLPTEDQSVLEAASVYFEWLGDREKAEAYLDRARSDVVAEARRVLASRR